MRYLLTDIDVTRDLPEIVLDPEQDGVGIVVRRDQRPIGFVLHELARGAALTAADVARLLGDLRNGAGPQRDAPAVAAGRVPSVTAAICTRDRPQQLARCLASLQQLASSPVADRLGLEILVVDNAPPDDRACEVVARSRARYVRAPVRGLDFARNCALDEARGEFVAFFDDDVTVDPGWLDGFVEALQENPDAAAVTGPVVPYELATRAQILFEEYGGFGHRFQKIRHDPQHSEDPLFPCSPGRIGAGCNMAVRRSVVQALGGFDEALDTGASLPGGGDMDVFYRILRAGNPIVTEPRCLVSHQHRRTYEELRRQMWTWGLGFMAFVAKSYRTDPSQRAKFRRLIVQWFWRRTVHAVLCATGHARRPVGLAVAQLTGGLVGLFGEYSRSERRVRQLLAGEAVPFRARQEAT